MVLLLYIIDFKGLIEWLTEYFVNVSVIIQTILTFIITILTVIALCYARRAWKGLRKEERDRQEQINNLVIIAEQTKAQTETLEETLGIHKKQIDLIEKLLENKENINIKDDLKEVEKQIRRNSIKPRFVADSFGCSTFGYHYHFINKGKRAYDIQTNILKKPNDIIPLEFPKDEILDNDKKITIVFRNADNVNNFANLMNKKIKLQIIYQDEDENKYEQIIDIGGQSRSISKPELIKT